MTVDLGLTHVALPVTDVDASVDFYRRYADMAVVHRRHDDETDTTVAWVSDRHNLELSHGQEVGLTVERAGDPGPERPGP
jgi:catechol 2,3-dioxygenase-like lactoylglutathione lyase family enzyme